MLPKLSIYQQILHQIYAIYETTFVNVKYIRIIKQFISVII